MMRRLLALLFLLAGSIDAAGKEISDDVLYDRVRIELANDRVVKGGRIQVEVRAGVVELTGKVKTDRARQKAERVARKVKGVKNVINKLTLE